MRRKILFGLVIMMILFGLVAWIPADPGSLLQPFITEECLVQSPPDSTGVSLETAVPSCWLAEEIN